LVHQLMRDAVERVDLKFRVVRLPKINRYEWEEGVITLRGFSELSTTGPGRG
jgi:hypothetical protein